MKSVQVFDGDGFDLDVHGGEAVLEIVERYVDAYAKEHSGIEKDEIRCILLRKLKQGLEDRLKELEA